MAGSACRLRRRLRHLRRLRPATRPAVIGLITLDQSFGTMMEPTCALTTNPHTSKTAGGSKEKWEVNGTVMTPTDLPSYIRNQLDDGDYLCFKTCSLVIRTPGSQQGAVYRHRQKVVYVPTPPSYTWWGTKADDGLSGLLRKKGRFCEILPDDVDDVYQKLQR
ncbi:unnamed protein product [Symbiodinium microadriaticum]|nr:unnamed protein product [Symbiodinium microadriaticum]CAE7946446.1 unnamed protein product [Symbiodinium sp. KB8]